MNLIDHLLFRIARRPNIAEARKSSLHACHSVVTAQAATADDFHLPEPWNGDLASARVLFVSSNPAIGEGEDYPHAAWSDELIRDYFTNRFGGGAKEWTRNANRGLKTNGRYGPWSPFWSAIRLRAEELYGSKVRPGRDFALTEVVHCKSLRENGVRTAADTCAALYLRPVLEASGAAIIVTLGRIAETYVRRAFPFDGHVSPPFLLGGRERVIATLPHPNARQVRSFAQCFTEAELGQLRAHLATAAR